MLVSSISRYILSPGWPPPSLFAEALKCPGLVLALRFTEAAVIGDSCQFLRPHVQKSRQEAIVLLLTRSYVLRMVQIFSIPPASWVGFIIQICRIVFIRFKPSVLHLLFAPGFEFYF